MFFTVKLTQITNRRSYRAMIAELYSKDGAYMTRRIDEQLKQYIPGPAGIVDQINRIIDRYTRHITSIFYGKVEPVFNYNNNLINAYTDALAEWAVSEVDAWSKAQIDATNEAAYWEAKRAREAVVNGAFDAMFNQGEAK